MKPNLKKVLWILVPLLTLVAVLLVLFLPKGGEGGWHQAAEPGKPSAAAGTAPEPEQTEQTSEPATSGSRSTVPAEQTEPGFFPYDLAEGKLQVTSLFQYSGLNPDDNWNEGENIGAIVVTNVSQEYLAELTVTAELSDGSQLVFRASDLPPGGTLWAFAQDSAAFDPQSRCTELRSDSTFASDPGSLNIGVTPEVQGVEVSLTNTGAQALKDQELRCHILLNGIYFGGDSYAYPVAELPAGQTVTVTAGDCILGEAGPCWLGPKG